MRESQNFTEGKIFWPLIKFAMPALAAMLLQTMYGAVDMMIVGHFATAADASAISTGSWIMTIITSLVIGIATGTTVLLGRKLGEGRPQEAGGIIGASVILFAGISVVLTAVVVGSAPTIARLMHTPAEAMEPTITYIRICAGGSIFIVAFNVLGSIFRGIGNSTVPLLTVAIACVVNIVGDLLLVAVFHMATAGAAIATVFAQLVSVVLSLIIVSRQKLPFTICRADFKFHPERIKDIVRIGLPVALQDVLVNVSFLVLTAIVNSLGVVISAGVGVAEKLCGFVLLAPSAFSQTMTSVVAQNMGADKPERAKKALLYGIASSFAVGAVASYFSFFHGDLMASIFSNDPAVIDAAAQYLKAYAIDTLLVSVMFCMSGYFTGCGRTTFAMIQGIIGAFCVRIPFSFVMSRRVPVNLFHIGLATPASSLLQTILCVIYYYHMDRKQKRMEGSYEKSGCGQRF